MDRSMSYSAGPSAPTPAPLAPPPGGGWEGTHPVASSRHSSAGVGNHEPYFPVAPANVTAPNGFYGGVLPPSDADDGADDSRNRASGSGTRRRRSTKHSANNVGDTTADSDGDGDADDSGRAAAAAAKKRSRPAKVRKVVVTSCDTCRARKLRCDAKELPLGEPCSTCVKSKQPCSFDYCVNTAPGTIRLRNRVAEFDGPERMEAAGALESLAGAGAISIGSNGANANKKGLWANFGTLPASLRFANDDPTSWFIPEEITSADTNERRRYPLSGVIDTLFARFFEAGHLTCFLVDRNDIRARWDAQQASRKAGKKAEEVPASGPKPVPSVLALAMLAAAAVSAPTSEPELIEWGRNVAWHLAVRGVQRRLAIDSAPDVEVISAALIVAASWCGETPNSQERISLFETAFRAAFDLNLNSASELPMLPPQVRAQRSVLFWTLYSLDKTLALICRRPPLLPSELHTMPRLALSDIVISRAIGSDRLFQALREADAGAIADNEDVWSCRLLESFVALSTILEAKQLALAERRAAQAMQYQAVQAQIGEAESKLEEWCQKHGELLSTATGEGPMFQGVAEALVALLHVAQLQLYSPALRFEARGAKGPIRFSEASGKALTACIESAWHLIQQPESRLAPASSSGPQQAHGAGSAVVSSITSLGVIRATQFLRFLSQHWADWNQGYGMHDCLPNRGAPDLAQSSSSSGHSTSSIRRSRAPAQLLAQARRPSRRSRTRACHRLRCPRAAARAGERASRRPPRSTWPARRPPTRPPSAAQARRSTTRASGPRRAPRRMAPSTGTAARATASAKVARSSRPAVPVPVPRALLPLDLQQRAARCSRSRRRRRRRASSSRCPRPPAWAAGRPRRWAR